MVESFVLEIREKEREIVEERDRVHLKKGEKIPLLDSNASSVYFH